MKADPNAATPKAPKGIPLDEGSPALKFPVPLNVEGEEAELEKAPVLPFIRPPVAKVEARKGFAAPPVICGRRPAPRLDPPNPPNDAAPVGWEFIPVGCELKADAAAPKEGIPPGAEIGVDAATADEEELAVPVGFGLEPEIGGKDSNNDAPKDDEGLNALSPLNPVVCGLSVGDRDIDGGLDVDVDVAPVGWLFNDENTESEKPDPVVAVFCEFRNGNAPDEFGRLGTPALSSSALLLLNENDEATLAISPLPSARTPNPFIPPDNPVCCCCWGWALFATCCCPFILLLVLLPPIANSISVGAFGIGGAGATGTPNGFLEPV